MYVVVFAGKLPEALVSSLPEETKRNITPIKVRSHAVFSRIIARKHHRRRNKLDRILMLPVGAFIQLKAYREWRHIPLENLIDLSGHSVNSKEVASYINSLNPKSVILVGTELLKMPGSISCSSLFNLHSGLSPKYRGLWNWFWPSYFGDFENNGVTIHNLEFKADSGSVLLQEKYITAAKDSLHDMVKASLMAQRKILIEFFSRNQHDHPIVDYDQGEHLFEPGISALFKYKMNWHKP
jgi:hypothetical protein